MKLQNQLILCCPRLKYNVANMFSNLACNTHAIPVVSFLHLHAQTLFFFPVHSTLKLDQICNSFKWTSKNLCRWNFAALSLSYVILKKKGISRSTAHDILSLLAYFNLKKMVVYIWVFYILKIINTMKRIISMIRGKKQVSHVKLQSLHFGSGARIYLNMRAAGDLNTGKNQSVHLDALDSVLQSH